MEHFEERRKVDKAKVVEEHIMSIVWAGLLVLAGWNTYATHENSVYLATISTKLEVALEANLTSINRINTLDASVQAIDRRLSVVESTRYSDRDHEKFSEDFKEWVLDRLDKKVDK